MKRSAIVALAMTAVLALAGCTEPGGTYRENQPPTVWLAAAPPEGSTSKYRIQLFWGGWDPDGEIRRYEYLITNNDGAFNPADTVGVPWTPVVGNDSTFTFSADEPVDTLNVDPTRQVAEFTRSHTFFIRSIDTEGMRSREPAYRSFTAFTVSPQVRIQVPVKWNNNPADVPPITTFRWKAEDFVSEAPPLGIAQDPDSVQYVLKSTKDFLGDFVKTIDYLRDYRASAKDWRPWVWYRAPGDSGKFWTTPPVDPGRYVFAIRAKDEAGAVTPTLDEEQNVRRVRVGPRSSGPLMSLSNEYMDIIRTTSCTTPLAILDVPAGVPLTFKVKGDAFSYGGTVAGYRYGWDITDLNDPETWDIDLTPFATENNTATIPPRTFFFGTHNLTVEVVDNSGYCSRVFVKTNIVQFTLERSVLVVDDDTTDDNSAGWIAGGSPTDAEHDAFWLDMVSEVAGFDPQLDMVDTRLGDIPLTTLARYKSIIWSVYGDRATRAPTVLLYQFIQHRPKNPPTTPTGTAGTGKVKPNVMALTMAAGGHIMIAGRQPVQLVINRTYAGGARFPIIWKYELEGQQTTPPSGDALTNPVGDLSFAYRDLCLETMEFAVLDSPLITRPAGTNRRYCPTSNVRGATGSVSLTGDGMRYAAPLMSGFPTLTLRPEAAGPGGYYREDSQSVPVEIYNPFYFQVNSGQNGSCQYAAPPRPCFQPIYGNGCKDTTEPVYMQPVAFFTSVYADRVARDVPGAVAARSVVFGFQPVLINPAEFQQVMDRILFEEWRLARGAGL